MTVPSGISPSESMACCMIAKSAPQGAEVRINHAPIQERTCADPEVFSSDSGKTGSAVSPVAVCSSTHVPADCNAESVTLRPIPNEAPVNSSLMIDAHDHSVTEVE